MEQIVIIGGGASGIMAAINAKTSSNKVIILEKNETCGKKILVTGNGRCNYWNNDQNISHYHSNTPEIIDKIITPKNNKDIISFFTNLGIYPKIKNGYYYPYSNQASTIKNTLINELERLNIQIINNFNVIKIEQIDSYYNIYSEKNKIKADKLIIATGSKASPKTGSTGDGYKFLNKLGHTVIEPLPALVQLVGEESYFNKWAGIRTEAKVSLYSENKCLAIDEGELQLTNYGISGICIFNLSYLAAKLLKKGKKVEVRINFLPFLKTKTVEELSKLLNKNYGIKKELECLLNNKLVPILLNIANVKNDNLPFIKQDSKTQEKIKEVLTNFKINIIKTKSFEEAQICSGGLLLDEINTNTMESKKHKNLFIIGELLDLNGDCGGYNLTIAWITGMLAGKGSAKNDKNKSN